MKNDYIFILVFGFGAVAGIVQLAYSIKHRENEKFQRSSLFTLANLLLGVGSIFTVFGIPTVATASKDIGAILFVITGIVSLANFKRE